MPPAQFIGKKHKKSARHRFSSAVLPLAKLRRSRAGRPLTHYPEIWCQTRKGLMAPSRYLGSPATPRKFRGCVFNRKVEKVEEIE
jgi:hypothetical protein